MFAERVGRLPQDGAAGECASHGWRRAGASLVSLATVVALSAFVPSAAHGTVGDADAAAVDDTADCSSLLIDGYCELRYADHSNQTSFVIPEGVDDITVILSGGSGEAGDGRGRGGQGTAMIASIDMTKGAANRSLSVWLGGQGQDMDDEGQGWSKGGQGNSDFFGTANGGAGGGSSALTWTDDGFLAPLMVAGGGGGSGHIDYWPLGGGAGGAGGTSPSIGDGGYGVGATGGAGGPGAGAPDENGDNGHKAGGGASIALAGAGGGGGGFAHGGSGGHPGIIAYRTKGKPGGGGGGGAGDSYWFGREDALDIIVPGAAAPLGDGSLRIFAGAVETYDCIPSGDSKTLEVPAEVSSYGFIAVGGAGQYRSSSGRAGSGAMVTGVLDVQGISSLDYWVACNSQTAQYSGWGRPGNGGGSSAAGGHDGRDGGAATAIALTTSPDVPLIVAGGGGGGGGDGGGCVGFYPASDCGGLGGSGGSSNLAAWTLDGLDGVANDGSPTGGAGGRSNANTAHGASVPDGGKGEHSGSINVGGGGGGGAGFPRGGLGGHQTWELYGDAGGGGGAGGSYTSTQRVSHALTSASGLSYSENIGPLDGFLMLMPLVRHTTDLIVTKKVTGDAASFAHGPFAVDVDCTLAGSSVLKDSFNLAPNGSHTLHGVVSGARCTVVERGTGGASSPAPPQTVTIREDPATVTLTNTFAATSFDVSVTSVTRNEDGEPDSSVHIPLGEVAVHVACALAGEAIALPAPVSGGELVFTGEDTWADDGVSQTVHGVPVGATCSATLAAGSGATSTAYAVDGTVVDGDAASFTLGTATTRVAVTDTYQLAPLTVAKAADGDGEPPPGAEYGGTVGCTFQGREVTLPGSAVFALQVEGSQQVHNLPVGARCTVTETDRGTAVGTTYRPSRTVPITAAGAAKVTVTNTFDSAALLVSVGTSGAGAQWANVPFTVHVTCTVGGVSVLDDTFTTENATGGWTSYTVDGDAACTATETATGGAAAVRYSSNTDGTPSDDPVTVTVPEDGTATLRVENVFTAAPLEISTSTSGDGAEYAFRATVVTADDCTFNGRPIDPEQGSDSVSFTLPAHGGGAGIPELVTGASCDVSETDPAGATESTYSTVNADPTATLASGGVRVTVNEPLAGPPTSVHIDNRFDLAALSVPLVVTGAAAWAANAAYAVAVTCTFLDEPVTRVGPGGVGVLDFAPDGTPLPDPASAALATLSVGSVCSAVETAAGGATTVVYDPAGSAGRARVAAAAVGGSAPVTVAAGGATIDITNTFDATALSATVVLAGNDATEHTDDEFFFDAVCTFNGQTLPAPPSDPTRSDVFTLRGGDTRVLDDLPVGAECTVNEFDTSHATEVTPGSLQIATLAVDATDLVFRNVFEVTALTVNEEITGAGAATYGLGQTYPVLVTCRWPDSSGQTAVLPDDGAFELSAANDFAVTFDAPVGTECSVGQARGMATRVTLPAPVTLRAGERHALPVMSTFLVAPITVEKSALGHFDRDLSFAFDTSCIWPGADGPIPLPLNGDVPGHFGVRSGADHAVYALQGARCTVTEAESHGALRTVIDTVGTDVSTDGATTTFTVAVGSATATTVSVTNYMQGSLPITGSEMTGVLIAGGLALLVVLLGLVFAIRSRRSRGR